MTADTPDIAKRAAEMRARAEAATRGPWNMHGKYEVAFFNQRGPVFTIAQCPSDDDAEHIVASQPANVLAILDALARADARADKAEQDLARLTVNASAAYDELKAELAVAQRKIDEMDTPVRLEEMRRGDLAVIALAAARETIGRLCELVQCLIDNDPDDPISDGGHVVLDLWRHDAKRILASVRKAGADA